MHIGIEGWIPLSINIDSDEFLNDDNDKALPSISVPTTESVRLPPPPSKNPGPKQKLAMTLEEEKSFIYNLLNDPSTFPPEVPIKEEENGKLGLMWPRNYAFDHPTTPLLFDYAQKGGQVDCGKYWTLEQIILVLEQGTHVSAKEPEATRQLHKENL